MKKEGSILLEVMASICIITIIISVGVRTYITSITNLRQRMLEEEINMCIYNLSNEIKFNLSYEDVKKLLDNKNEIGFKYDENFSKRLTEYEIVDLERGSDIKVIMKNCSDEKSEFLIDVCIIEENNRIEKKHEFSKSWWMDEI